MITHLGVGLGDFEGIKLSYKSIFELGLSRNEFIYALLSIGLMEWIHKIEKQDKMRHLFSERPIWVRWPLYFAMVLFLIFFGEYNDHVFFYFQF